ncbi:sensor domain-containing diguanylate cyclase [Leifsonia sp. fls2-241-R2A-40a]|uniref:GGDEF domain-containing protein n=1 Tax=Leifsonia sp. fls2-241-R2A-40a TaxID=3040290 RepID=UPI00254F4B0C|nr:sensor domain-containing diguanylate cyclase [Leifsonia sp. fls2-241-R2A-40a]
MTEDTGEQLYHPTPVRSSDYHPVVSSCTRTRPLRSGFKPPERDGDNGILRAAQRRATETETRTRVLQNAAATFGISDSIDDVASALTQIAREDVGAETAAVFLNNRQAQLLAGAVPFDSESFPVVPPGGWISSESRTWSRSIATTDPDVVAALDGAHLESLLIAPLLRGREVVGSLACFFSREQAADPHTVYLVSALCRQAAQVLAQLKLQAELAALALYDPLTGLANRILLRTHISSSVQTVGSDLESLALIFIDLDSFKSINDKFGHSAGDAVLATVASRITGSVRSGDLVCRFGRDEFIVVCQHTTQVEALAVAERIRTEIKHPSQGDGWTTPLTASVGVTVHPPDTSNTLTATDLLRTADQAMYRSNNRGKDRVSLITHP